MKITRDELKKENNALKKMIFGQIEENKKLHKAIYELVGEPYEWKNGKVTPVSEIEDKEYEDIEIYDYADNYEVMYPNIIANNFVHLNEDLQTITKAIKYIIERLDK